MQTPGKDLKYFISVAYVIGFIVLITMASATFLSFSSLLDKNRWVEHTNLVIFNAEQIVSLMKDAETGHRGYIITADSVYLEPYHNSLIPLRFTLSRLDSLTADNALQQTRIDTLQRLIEEKLHIIIYTIGLKNTNQIAELNTFFVTRQGKNRMDRIRQEVNIIVDEEKRLLAVRTDALNRSIEFTRYIILIVLAATFFIAIFLYFSTRRQLNLRESFTGELNKLNKELAASNEELSVTNEELKASHEEIATSHEEMLATNEELTQARQMLTELNQALETKIQERTKALQRASQAKAILLEREKAALLEAETERKRLHSLFMQAPALLAITKGPDFVYELANPLYQQTLGSSESINGKPLAEVLPDLEPAILNILNKVYQTGERFVGKELPIKVDWDNNGKPYIKYFNLIYEPLREASGQVSGVITFGYEVTEHIIARRKVEESTHLLNEANIALRYNNERLAEAQRQFQFLAEFMPQLVWSTKPNGDHDYFNKRWYDYTGLTFEETMNRGWSLVLHPDDYERTIQVWSHCLATGEQYEIEYRFRKYDGTYHWFLGRALPMRNEEGEIIKWFGTCTGIDEQKNLVAHLEQSREELFQKNEQLNRINTDLDNFIYTASHDLKSPITNIEGLTLLMGTRLQSKLNESEKELIRMIELSVARLKQTIADLTEITKVQKDLDSSVEFLSFEEVLSDVKTDIAASIAASSAVIHTEFNVQQIRFARKNLRSILYNLLTNAIKYKASDRHPQIYVTTSKANGFIQLSVRDNGLGIRQDQLDKIFMMFKRAHTHVEGTGIGLYIVKRIIENNGGRIEVNSREGEGTTFTIYFKEF